MVDRDHGNVEVSPPRDLRPSSSSLSVSSAYEGGRLAMRLPMLARGAMMVRTGPRFVVLCFQPLILYISSFDPYRIATWPVELRFDGYRVTLVLGVVVLVNFENLDHCVRLSVPSLRRLFPITSY